MSGDELIVIPGEPPRSAILISTTPLEVIWEDSGERETLEKWPAGCRRALRDTLAHKVLIDPVGVESAVSEPATAVDVVVWLLKDLDQPLSVTEIKRRLTDPHGSYCLAKPLVDRGLRGLPQRLRSHPSVMVLEEAVTKRGKTTVVPEFSWKAPGATDLPEPESRPREGAGSSGVASERTLEPAKQQPSADLHSPGDAPGARVEPSTDIRSLGGGHPADSDQEATSADQQDEHGGGAGREANAEPGGPPQADPLTFLDGHDLPVRLELESLTVAAVIARLNALDDKTLADVRARLEDAARFDLAVLLLATPRSAKPVAALMRDWPDEPEASAELVRGLRWMRSSDAALRRVLELVAERRTAPSDELTRFAVAELVRARTEVRPALLRIVSGAPPQAVTRALAEVDAPSLLRSVNRESLGTRSRLLWAAMRVRPESVHSPDVWGRDVSLEDLIALSARRPDDALLADPWVRDEIVAPKVEVAVQSVSSRRDLARVVNWPNPVFALAPPQRLATAVRKVAEHDSVVRDLVEAMAGRQEVERLRSRLVEAELEAERARQEAGDAREAERLAQAAEERSFQRAAAAEREQVAASQAELRQAHIGGIRALVDVLGLGGRLDRALTLGEGLNRMRDQATRSGVTAIGVTGTTERYEASRHELLGGERAEMVEVREPGYEFLGPDGAVVLRRAVVVPIAGGEADQANA